MEIRCEHCDKFTRHDAIDSLLEQRAALRVERDRLAAAAAKDREQLGRALDKQAEYLRQCAQLVEERDTLRAEIAELKAKWKREECAHCDERPGGHEGTIWCAECFNWHCSEAAKERMQSELDAARADAARLREALETLNHAAKVAISSQYGGSFDEDTPLVIRLLDGTCDATDAALASAPTTAEWLAARDEEQRRLGAAEWLEKEAADFYERFGTNWYESSTDSMLAEAARLRAGKGE